MSSGACVLQLCCVPAPCLVHCFRARAEAEPRGRWLAPDSLVRPRTPSQSQVVQWAARSHGDCVAVLWRVCAAVAG
eukprot:4762062-Pyramimonas_sp.AAC.1